MQDTPKIDIDRLIEIVEKGGAVKTGIDVHNRSGALLLEKDVIVRDAKPLHVIKGTGISQVPIDAVGAGGMWDKNGELLNVPQNPHASRKPLSGNTAQRIRHIHEIKKLAAEKHEKAKSCIRNVLEDIKKTGGEFDYQAVEMVVTELIDFLAENENAFSYLTREIFSYDNYLYNHSINVCTIATAALHKFNRSFSNAVNMFLGGLSFENLLYGRDQPQEAFILFNDEEIRQITIGFFLHDVGKVAIPGNVLNKNGPLDREEKSLVRLHSYDKGQEILNRNGIQDPFVRNIVRYHHCTLYPDEPHCYPENLAPPQVPPYVKVCKLADMYDAMTSKRCYKDAFNPVSVVTDLFRKYANKDRLLQFIVDSFVRTVGIYPAGSVLQLRNGQKAFIIDSNGPIVVPFTDIEGNKLKTMSDAIDLAEVESFAPELGIDRRAALVSPLESYESLPSYLKEPVKYVSSG